MAQPYMSSRSPPPLQHPKPTHPAYPPPEPPKTPGGSTNSSPYSQAQRISSDGGYQRYSSPPVDGGSSAATATATGYAPSSLGSASGFAGYGPQAGGLPGSEAHNRNGYVHAPSPGQPQGYGQVPPTGPGQAQNFGGWQVNDATTQMGVQFGKSAVAAGQDYVEKNVSHESWLLTLQLDLCGKELTFLLVYAIPPATTHQDFIRSHQLLCSVEAATDSISMATQDLDEADSSVKRKWSYGRLAATSRRYQCSRPLHPK